MYSHKFTKLDPNTNSISALELLAHIRGQLVGQDEAVKMITDLFEIALSPLADSNKPAVFTLFLGPSGVGKTTLATLLGQFLLNSYGSIGEEVDPDERIITSVDCASYFDRHEVTRVIGAPPGYKGYDDIPLLDQRHIDDPALQRLKKLAARGKFDHKAADLVKQIDMLYHETHGIREANQMDLQMSKVENAVEEFKSYLRNEKDIRIWSVVLLDEFEKADNKLHDIFLPVFSGGSTTLANGKTTSFRDCAVIMTSNAGSDLITNKAKGKGQIGFTNTELDKSVKETALNALKKVFKTEFLGRLGKKTVVFHFLTEEQIRELINLKIELIKKRLNDKHPIILDVDESIYKYLMSTSMHTPEYGARLVESNIEDTILLTLAKLINSGEVKQSNVVTIKMSKDNKFIEFYRQDPLPPKEMSIPPDAIDQDFHVFENWDPEDLKKD